MSPLADIPLSNGCREALIAGVEAAGREVMAIYRRGFEVAHKNDASPLTEADLVAHHALLALLARLTPKLPVLSEESAEVPWATRQRCTHYWLVDPLDGTREFIQGNDEFTLNLALVVSGVPSFGIVHAPALGEGGVTWWGEQRRGAFIHEAGSERRIRVRPLPDPNAAPWRVLGSRRDGKLALERFCQRLPRHERLSLGSSIKLCRVAEGEADLYPRLAPTCEWDTAAAQAVLTAAGGALLEAESLAPLRCNRGPSLLNPFFIACGQRDPRWESALAAALAAHDS